MTPANSGQKVLAFWGFFQIFFTNGPNAVDK
jgi:hypothetical protein